jgi:SpoVK/Ycf46/Vps4 family AAA+-type ATPase
VFLRALEYYEGIMFLTTNRIDSFDPAFKSRIHLSMKYPPLCREFRRELWSHFIENGISDEVDTSVQEPSFLNEMSEYNFNGRQIRNVVRTAYSLAVSWGDELSAIHINTTLSAMSNFDNLDEGTSDVEQDHENSVNKSSRKRRRES